MELGREWDGTGTGLELGTWKTGTEHAGTGTELGRD